MKVQRLESIIELAALLNQQSDFRETLRLVTRKAATLLDAETALVLMVNPSTRETIKTLHREGSEPASNAFRTLHTYLTGWVIEHNQGFFTDDISADRRFRSELVEGLPVKSVMCAPLMGDGIITGTLLLMKRSEDHIFSGESYACLEKLADVVSPFLRNIQEIRQYFISAVPEETLIKKYQAHGLLGTSERFIQLLQSIEAASACDVRVLLEGQSGTGKELVGRAIHHLSARASSRFVAIDCGAIPRDLIESELFGHVKGAFTGATESRKGLLEEADGGTLFMDEINNLPLDVQAKFLRMLQEKEIRPLGSNQVRRIDVRIIAASSVSLKASVDSKEFREDLFYRLYVYPIGIPTLEDRKQDIPLLANHFLKEFAGEQQKEAESFSGGLMEFLKGRSWPGNVRELENFVERLVTLSLRDSGTIDSSVLPSEYKKGKADASDQKPESNTSGALPGMVADFERRAIEDTLAQCNWNQSEAARMLGISEHTIRYKMKNLGIVRQDSRSVRGD